MASGRRKRKRKMKTEKTEKRLLVSARKSIEKARASAMFALQMAEKSLRELPTGATIGEEGERLAVRITALTLTIEEMDRASDNFQRAIETF